MIKKNAQSAEKEFVLFMSRLQVLEQQVVASHMHDMRRVNIDPIDEDYHHAYACVIPAERYDTLFASAITLVEIHISR